MKPLFDRPIRWYHHRLKEGFHLALVFFEFCQVGGKERGKMGGRYVCGGGVAPFSSRPGYRSKEVYISSVSLYLPDTKRPESVRGGDVLYHVTTCHNRHSVSQTLHLFHPDSKERKGEAPISSLRAIHPHHEWWDWEPEIGRWGNVGQSGGSENVGGLTRVRRCGRCLAGPASITNPAAGTMNLWQRR